MTPVELVQDKIHELTEMSRRRCGWRTYSQRTVFTNGVFDLLHAGHLAYLQEAAALGTRLIVGVNTDESVRRLKGTDRPVNSLQDRMEMLASFFYVDGVIAFDSDTPLELIKKLNPDVLVKGGDYTEDTIVGAAEVKARGGEVKVLTFKDGYSTTGLIHSLQGR